jgi:hypothetical protein
MKATTLLAETLMAALLAVPMLAQVTPTDEKVPCRTYKDVLALFDRLGYTQKAWQAGIREIPRVYLADVPDTWRERSAKLSVADRIGLQEYCAPPRDGCSLREPMAASSRGFEE